MAPAEEAAGGVRVHSLFLYPVKSCGGLSVAQAIVTPTGFQWDRQWMVVNADTGRFITQRQEPRLSLVRPSLPPEALQRAWGALPPETALALSAPGMPPLHLPLALEAYARTPCHVAVWEWSGEALDAGPDAAAWFSSFLGRSLRVVRFASGSAKRPVDSAFAPGHETTFTDGYPFLVASQASLSSLNSRLDSPLDINRFRPNILVEGCSEFEEDRWRKFQIGEDPGLLFQGVKPCSRCKVTTVMQETAETGKEPLRTLATFRTAGVLELPKPFSKAEVFFGMNAVCTSSGEDSSSGVVQVGDPVQVMELAETAKALLGA